MKRDIYRLRCYVIATSSLSRAGAVLGYKEVARLQSSALFGVT